MYLVVTFPGPLERVNLAGLSRRQLRVISLRATRGFLENHEPATRNPDRNAYSAYAVILISVDGILLIHGTSKNPFDRKRTGQRRAFHADEHKLQAAFSLERAYVLVRK